MVRVNHARRPGWALSTLLAIALTVTTIVLLSSPGSTLADGGDFSMDFLASEPSSYEHSTGGGAYNGGVVGVDIVESLEGGRTYVGVPARPLPSRPTLRSA